MISSLFVFSIIYFIYASLGAFLIMGAKKTLFIAKMRSLPILLLNLSNFCGVVAVYFGANKIVIISLIILNLASIFFMIESVKRAQSFGWPLPKFWRWFDNFNTPLSVVVSWSLYIMCGMAIYNKFFS